MIKQKAPRPKSMPSLIDAMKHGEYRIFDNREQAKVFSTSAGYLRRAYKRRIFTVIRKTEEGYKTWILRY